MFTLLLAKDLKGTKIKVNAYAPSLAATQSTHNHDHAVEIAVRSIISLATLFDDDGPTGKIFGQDNEELKW
jgi:NAD(P)-dependent dehydrogenase (short-subunit alcohol dehydrogenase family)